MKPWLVDAGDCGAYFSPCRTYRYSLWRCWDPAAPILTFIGLNPSTADELHDDPTIRRCIAFAKREGCGRLIMLNLFAYRATDPRVMRQARDPVGPSNIETIVEVCRRSSHTVFAWGAGGRYRNQDLDVWDVLRARGIAPKCLGTTQDGFPRHPLYVRGDAPLVPWEPKA